MLYHFNINAVNFINGEKLAHHTFIRCLHVEDGSPQGGEAVHDGYFRRDGSNFGGDFGGIDEVASLGSWWMKNNQKFTRNSVWVVHIVNLASTGQGSSQADKCEEQCNLHLSGVTEAGILAESTSLDIYTKILKVIT